MSAAEDHSHNLVDAAEVRRAVEILHAMAAGATRGMADPGVLQACRKFPGDDNVTWIGRYRIGEVDRMVRDALIEARNGANVYVEGRTIPADAPPWPRQKGGDPRRLRPRC